MPFREASLALVNIWAEQLADWVIPRFLKKFKDLDGWTPPLGGESGWVVYEEPLSAFVRLGAHDEMPYTVYKALDTRNQSTIQPILSWIQDIKYRRDAGRYGPMTNPHAESTTSGFREDLIKFLAANRLKKVQEIEPNGDCFKDVLEERIYLLPHSVQLGLFMHKLDLNRYGAMDYDTYRSLLAEFGTIVSFTCNTYPQLTDEDSQREQNI